VDSRRILDALAVAAWAPPLRLLRESGAIGDVSHPLCVVMLLIDFDTEVLLNGIIGFIGNSTGRYARQTVAAFERVGCEEEAGTLLRILDHAEAAGITHEALQRARSAIAEYSVVTPAGMHGDGWDLVCARLSSMCDEIDMQAVFGKVGKFIMRHRQTFEQALPGR
jgi:hypothetical protein